jgi:protein-disulfide isomerase
VEFTDYQCPFCSRHFQQTWPRLEQEFVNTGKVKFVLRDMPLEAIHPQALKAAEAARCAGDQGKYWEMHDRLFTNQNALARKDLTAHAQALGLDVAVFDKCVDSAKYTVKVRNDIIEAARGGGRGTPVFFLGLTEPSGTELKAVRIIRGAQSYAAFKDAIEPLLAEAK